MKQVITLLVVGIFMVSLMGVALASQGDNSVGISVNAMAGQSDDTGNSDNESGDDNSDDKGEGNTTRERIEIKQGEEKRTEQGNQRRPMQQAHARAHHNECADHPQQHRGPSACPDLLTEHRSGQSDDE